MTVKTLTYIQQLLIENEAKLKAEKNKAFKAREAAYEADKNDPEIPRLCEEYNSAFEAYIKARDARYDFEEKEW